MEVAGTGESLGGWTEKGRSEQETASCVPVRCGGKRGGMARGAIYAQGTD